MQFFVGIAILLIAFAGNIYVAYLVITDTAEKRKIREIKRREEENAHFASERDKFFRYMHQNLNINYYDVVDEYKKIKTYDQLISRNIDLETQIQKYNL